MSLEFRISDAENASTPGENGRRRPVLREGLGVLLEENETCSESPVKQADWIYGCGMLLARSNSGRLVAILGLLMVAVVAFRPATPAHATNWFGASGDYGSCGHGNQADSNPLTFYYSDLTSAARSAVEYIRVNRLEPTDITTSTPSGSLSSTTDIVVYDRYYVDHCNQPWSRTHGDGGVVGYTTCHAKTSTNRCEQHSVRMSNIAIDQGTTVSRWLACHEVGHAVGLAHRLPSGPPLGCMPGGGSTGLNTYTSHDLGHINAAW